MPVALVFPNQTMRLEDIYSFYEKPHLTFLNRELAVCYIFSVLLEGHSYGTELIQRLEQEYPHYRLSDTVLYAALKFLEDEQCISGYWQKVEGRGRPRRMYQLNENVNKQAEELAMLWKNYIERSLLAQPIKMRG